jgi:hypothetical protein
MGGIIALIMTDCVLTASADCQTEGNYLARYYARFSTVQRCQEYVRSKFTEPVLLGNMRVFIRCRDDFVPQDADKDISFAVPSNLR